MKHLLLVVFVIKMLLAQPYTELFDPNSIYLNRGLHTIEIDTLDNTDIDKSYTAFNKISWRTIAVNPKKILPGSVVFIPDLAGFKISDRLYHDGYVFAHRVLNNKTELKLKIYTANKTDLSLQNVKVFVVQGATAKSMRSRYELQYRQKKELPTYKMVASDFTKLMQWGKKEVPDIHQRIQKYSELGKGTPYLIYNLGEGAGSLIDPDPTIDFARTDCMTFCEHTLALAISSDYKEMYNNLQKIRYKDGEISYTTRNHYTIVDWLPNNSWLLQDVTKQIAGAYSKKMTKKIDRPAFYKNNGVPEADLKSAPQEKKVTIDYVPTAAILKIQDRLQGGEIVSVVTTHPAVVSAHMGIIIRDRWDNIIFRHASSSEWTNEVIDERLSDYVAKMAKSKSRVGMLFVRARENYTIPY